MSGALKHLSNDYIQMSFARGAKLQPSSSTANSDESLGRGLFCLQPLGRMVVPPDWEGEEGTRDGR